VQTSIATRARDTHGIGHAGHEHARRHGRHAGDGDGKRIGATGAAECG
jgi:hypothetical protein